MKLSRSTAARFFFITSMNLAVLVLLFLLINIISYWALERSRKVEDKIGRPDVRSWFDHWDRDTLLKLYPNHSYDEIIRIHADQASVNPIYEPFYQYRYPETKSETFNINAAGFRSIGLEQGPWPPPSKPARSVFIFGGSTTMGAGVADNETIAAHLQRRLRAAHGAQSVFVYNFGTNAYQSTQEVIRLQILVQAGYVPDVAVFVDGLNDLIIWNGEPVLTPMLKQAADLYQNSFTQDTISYHAMRILHRLPMAEYTRFLAQGSKKPQPFPQVQIAEAELNDPKKFDASIARYLANQRIARGLGQEFGIRTIAVWQPITTYAYPFEDVAMKMLSGMDSGHHYVMRGKYGYQRVIEKHKADMLRQPGFLWCADIQKTSNQMLYVDHAHYNGAGADLLAGCISESIRKAN